ncbi:hypothetical protein OESDEN_00717 [Oesophagostomum dentatum]|uniref:Amidase domain-containing protein n=1 Tax=Oesophagostomum dentatum TaxID=61180 RepID=A0A0B1TTX8_OESDE|nr:hypothetical protein OESDEN_00717 [Oesophagostomum dentatum]
MTSGNLILPESLFQNTKILLPCPIRLALESAFDSHTSFPPSKMFYVVITLLIIFITVFLRNRLVRKHRRNDLNAKLARRSKERAINFESARNNAEKIEQGKAEVILSWDFDQLREKLQKGQVSCTDALRAYQRAALSANKQTNCVCMFIEDAIEIAKTLDEQAANPNYKKPLFFGVPVSIKESIRVSLYSAVHIFP